MSTENEKIAELAEKIYPEIVAIRHILHQNPELSFKEFETAKLIEKTLTNFGITCQRLPDCTAVVGTITGLAGGGCIALRADMDALPIQEKSGLAFMSNISEVMHACGHDLHTANLLGVAHILKNMSAAFQGTIKLLFQPAEEMGGGAQELIDFGVLKNPPVNACLAAHTSENTLVGQVVIKPEEVMLASAGFTIDFTGEGGHGAAPHKTQDPLLAAASYIVEIQALPGRAQNFLDPAIITVGYIKGGTRANIIAQKVTIRGSIRAQRKEAVKKIIEKMRQLLQAKELATGVKGIIEITEGLDAVYNDIELTEQLRQVAKEILGKENVFTAKFPANGSENFALFSSKIPSVFFHFGVKEDNGLAAAPSHSPYFTAADSSLLPAMKIMSKGALSFLQNFSTAK